MMGLRWLFAFLLMILCQVGASEAARPTVYRFASEQLKFQLQFNDGQWVNCSHQLMDHVPWWRVRCANRKFTVNTWATVHHSKTKNLSKVTFMYDVSEGVASSGEKLVQFHSHMTDMVVDQLSLPKELQSHIDVQNGQASLVLQVKFKK